MNTDRIEKTILLRAPLKRVWRAVADSKEFGTWFGMKFDGPFTPGGRMRGVIVPTAVDPEIDKGQKPYEGTPVEIMIEQMEPERLFSFRGHAGAAEREVDFSLDPPLHLVYQLVDWWHGVNL